MLSWSMIPTKRLTTGSEGRTMADGRGNGVGVKSNRPSRRGSCPLSFIGFLQPLRHWSSHHRWKWLLFIGRGPECARCAGKPTNPTLSHVRAQWAAPSSVATPPPADCTLQWAPSRRGLTGKTQHAIQGSQYTAIHFLTQRLTQK